MRQDINDYVDRQKENCTYEMKHHAVSFSEIHACKDVINLGQS